jgi:hypothetical protein
MSLGLLKGRTRTSNYAFMRTSISLILLKHLFGVESPFRTLLIRMKHITVAAELAVGAWITVAVPKPFDEPFKYPAP